MSQALAKDLKAAVAGEVLTVNDPGYIRAVSTYNGAVRHRPPVVVRPASGRDLSSTLSFAGRRNIPVTVRAGGHSSNGYGLNSTGIVIDNRTLSSIEMRDNEVLVGAGATWNQVYQYLQREDPTAFAVGATWPSVGVAGFLLGGGYSFVSRSKGLSCDNLLACDFVTTEGVQVEASCESSDPQVLDLFWALKGGGGGNFGIASRFKIRRHIAPEPMLTGFLVFPFDRIDEVLDVYDGWAATLPESISVYGAITAQSGAEGARSLSIRLSFAFTGDASDGLTHLAPLIALRPLETRFYSMRLPQWASALGGDDTGAHIGAYTRSAMLRSGDLKAAIPVLRRFLTAIPAEAVFLVWTHGGGAIARGSTQTSAYPHRDADYVLALRVFWPLEDPDAMRPLVTWGYRFFEDLAHLTSGAYINYIDPLLTNWQDAYYKNSYPRLCSVRDALDPRGRMLFQQGIGSNFAPQGFVDDDLDLSPVFRTFHC